MGRSNLQREEESDNAVGEAVPLCGTAMVVVFDNVAVQRAGPNSQPWPQPHLMFFF